MYFSHMQSFKIISVIPWIMSGAGLYLIHDSGVREEQGEEQEERWSLEISLCYLQILGKLFDL